MTPFRYQKVRKKPLCKAQKLKNKVKKLKYQIKTKQIDTKEAHKFLTGHLGYIDIANVKNLKEKLFYIE